MDTSPALDVGDSKVQRTEDGRLTTFEIFELKEEHFKLFEALDFFEGAYPISLDGKCPFGDGNEAADVLGWSTGADTEREVYARGRALCAEMVTAMNIIASCRTFEPGTFEFVEGQVWVRVVEELNPLIVRTVEWLNDNGFKTCDSGDGVTHKYECDRDEAYVVIVLDDPSKMAAEAMRLKVLVESMGITVKAVNLDGEPSIQADFDPVNGRALLQLLGVNDHDIWSSKPYLDETLDALAK